MVHHQALHPYLIIPITYWVFPGGGSTYSTGVDNDAILTARLGAAAFTPMSFLAFPVASLPTPGSSGTFVGVGANFGGGPGDRGLPSGSMEYFLTDGKNGLDISTGVYNLPAGGVSRYTVASINPAAVGDGKPDIIIAQMGDYGAGAARDEFKFMDEAGNTVGNTQTVDFFNVSPVGTADFKFYTVSTSGVLTFTTATTGTRQLRLVAFDFSDFFTTADISRIKSFAQVLSGVSDQPFIAYNNQAIVVYQTVSGFVYNANASRGYNNIRIELYQNNTKVAETTTDNAGYYIFGDVAPGNYTVRIVLPNGATIVNAADGNTDPDITIGVAATPVAGIDYYLDYPLPVSFGPIEAFTTGNQLFVNWTTEKETNNQYFEVEASKDGQTFTSIGKISSKAINGNSDVPLDYHFSIDMGAQAFLGLSVLSVLLLSLVAGFKNRKAYLLYVLVAGATMFGAASCKKSDSAYDDKQSNVFIRIKQVDKDGTFKYSRTIKVEKR